MKVLIGSLFLCSLFAAAQTVSVPITRPLALDRLQQPPSDLFVLTPSKVYALRDDGQNLGVVGSFPLPSYESPSDIVLAIINKQQFVIVSGSNPTSGGFISMYTSVGQQTKTWTSQRPLCGMDYDARGTIYTASCETNEIYQASLQGKNTTSFVAEIAGAHHLGPVIVDNVRGQLIVGEIDNGQVYALDLRTHRSHLLARGFGSPQAFTFSANLQQLLVADSTHRTVYRLDLTTPSPSPVPFGTSAQFQEPDGLALLSSARVAVADDRANAIFVLPASGQTRAH
jgi:hypothetical protein